MTPIWKEDAGEDEHQRHHVHHGALRLSRGLFRSGMLLEGQGIEERLLGHHEDNRGDEDMIPSGFAGVLLWRSTEDSQFTISVDTDSQ